jgi:hypothetical protein
MSIKWMGKQHAADRGQSPCGLGMATILKWKSRVARVE